jgi:hypothetical protein
MKSPSNGLSLKGSRPHSAATAATKSETGIHRREPSAAEPQRKEIINFTAETLSSQSWECFLIKTLFLRALCASAVCSPVVSFFSKSHWKFARAAQIFNYSNADFAEIFYFNVSFSDPPRLRGEFSISSQLANNFDDCSAGTVNR